MNLSLHERKELADKWTALRVPCPFCKADPGVPCEGQVLYHVARLKRSYITQPDKDSALLTRLSSHTTNLNNQPKER